MVHGCLRVGGYVCGWHIYSQLCASFTYFGELLCCPHKHNMMKVYIERKNIQVELIRFRKKISTLFTFSFSNRVIQK